MSVGRYAAALDLITMYLARDREEEEVVPLVEQGLRGLRENNDPEMRRLSEWYLEGLFSLLERHKSVLGETRLASLNGLTCLRSDISPTFRRFTALWPTTETFFVDVVKTVYRLGK
jgi:hypothetical protein